MFIFVDMEVFDVEFSMIENTPGIAHISLAKAKGFHFRAFQYEPGFIFMKEGVFMPDFSVDDFQWCNIVGAKLMISFEFRVTSIECRVFHGVMISQERDTCKLNT